MLKPTIVGLTGEFVIKQLTLNILWLLITGLLISGMVMPMFTFTHFYFFDDTFSLTQGIFHLLQQDEYALFILLFSFSLAVPLFKMLLLLYNINSFTVSHHVKRRRLNRIAQLGKWSMLDVFVIAILAVTIKLGMIAQITIHIGLTIFAIAVILSMLLPIAINYLQPPPRIVTNDIERHNYLVLAPDQLSQLFDRHRCVIEQQPKIAQTDDLLDIFDNNENWQAKVLVEQVSKETERNRFSLTITLYPSNRNKQDAGS